MFRLYRLDSVESANTGLLSASMKYKWRRTSAACHKRMVWFNSGSTTPAVTAWAQRLTLLHILLVSLSKLLLLRLLSHTADQSFGVISCSSRSQLRLAFKNLCQKIHVQCVRHAFGLSQSTHLWADLNSPRTKEIFGRYLRCSSRSKQKVVRTRQFWDTQHGDDLSHSLQAPTSCKLSLWHCCQHLWRHFPCPAQMYELEEVRCKDFEPKISDCFSL